MYQCIYIALNLTFLNYPAGTQRPEDVPLWPYFGRDVPDGNKTKIGRIRF